MLWCGWSEPLLEERIDGSVLLADTRSAVEVHMLLVVVVVLVHVGS